MPPHSEETQPLWEFLKQYIWTGTRNKRLLLPTQNVGIAMTEKEVAMTKGKVAVTKKKLTRQILIHRQNAKHNDVKVQPILPKHSLTTNDQLPLTNHQLLITVYQSPITDHRLLFTVHQSPFTVHRSPKTTIPLPTKQYLCTFTASTKTLV